MFDIEHTFSFRKLTPNEVVRRLLKSSEENESSDEDYGKESDDIISPLNDTQESIEMPGTVAAGEVSKPKRTNPIKKRWKWTEEMAEALILRMADIKSMMEFKGLDFEADLVKLYTDLRQIMAASYPDDFGPETLSEQGGTMARDAITNFKVKISEEKKQIKLGYDRIKQKAKDIRQDYRKAVTEGRRSGSGKLVCENWDTLKLLWGGSPATKSIQNSCSTLISEADAAIDNETPDFHADVVVGESDEEEIYSDDESPSSNKDSTTNAIKRPATAKFVDNKRKMLEKNLSASQRDQIYLKVAQDDLKLKHIMVESLSDATRKSNEALGKISDSIASVGKSIGDGLALLATALSGQQQQQQFGQNVPGTLYADPTSYYETPRPSYYQNHNNGKHYENL